MPTFVQKKIREDTSPYSLANNQALGARHMSCEGCRSRKLRCSREAQCKNCTNRNETCKWRHAFPTRTPEFLSPEASQAEIARLNRVVMYLEARITRLTGNEAPSLTTPFRKDHVDQQPSPPSPPPPEPISAPTIPLCTTTSSYTFPVYPSPPPQLVPMPYQHPVAMPRQPTLLNPAMSYPSYGYDSYPSPATSTTSPEDFSFGALQAQYLEQGGAAIDWSLIAP